MHNKPENYKTTESSVSAIVERGLLLYIMSLPRVKQLFAWSIVNHLITIFIPFMLIFTMSKIWFISDSTTYMQLGFVFVFVVGLLLTVSLIKEQIFLSISNNSSTDISSDSFELLISLPYAHMGHLPVESQFSRMQPLRNFSRILMNEIIKPLLDLPLVIIAFSIISYLLGFMYFAFVTMIIIGVVIVHKLTYRRTSDSDNKSISDTVFYGTINDTFENIEAIEKHGKIEYFYNKLANLIDKRAIDQYLTSVKSSTRDMLIEALLMALYIGSLAIAVYSVLNEQLLVPNLIVIVILIWFCISPFKQCIDAFDKYKWVKEICNQFDLLKRATSSINRHKKIELNDKFNGEVMLKSVGVNFSSSSGFILSNINFNINKGEVLLINGSSGAGKSTILKLISGLYTPSTGVIAIDIDRNIIDQKSLSDKLILINDKSYLDSESICNNLKLVNNDNKLINNTIDKLLSNNNIDIEDFMTKPLVDYKQSIGGRDCHLSIVNKIILSKIDYNIKNKVILIDEPFMDNIDDIFSNFARVINRIKNDNTIIICSRYNFYSPLADKILVLNNGKIAKYFRKRDDNE